MARAKKEKVLVPIEDDRYVIGFYAREVSPLIMHAFDQKAAEEILAKHVGHPMEREPKIPRQCIERAKLRNTKGEVCFLPTALLKSLASAGTGRKWTTGFNIRARWRVLGNSIPIQWDRELARFDMVRIGGQAKGQKETVDTRFRPQFEGWRFAAAIQVPGSVSPKALDKLLALAGDVGIGEWRPQKGGIYGRWEVESIATKEQTADIIAACQSWVPPLVIPDWAMDAEIPAVLLNHMPREGDGPDDEQEDVEQSELHSPDDEELDVEQE